MKNSLTAKDLRKICDADSLKKNPATGIQLHNTVIGQERAAKALKLGVGIKATGFNIYAAGISGTGKLTAVKNFVEEPAGKEPIPCDWCYVNNFKDPYQPTKLNLPAGKAVEFKKDMKHLIHDALQTLIKAFESEEYASRRKKMADAFEKQQSAAINS